MEIVFFIAIVVEVRSWISSNIVFKYHPRWGLKLSFHGYLSVLVFCIVTLEGHNRYQITFTFIDWNFSIDNLITISEDPSVSLSYFENLKVSKDL